MIPPPTRSRAPIHRYLAPNAVWVIPTEKKMIGLLIDHGCELVAPIFDGAIIRRKDEATEINSPIEAVMDATGLVVDSEPFPVPPLQLEAMGSSHYYTHRLIRDPPSSAQRAPSGSLLRDYATPSATPEAGILIRPPTVAPGFRDISLAVQAAPPPSALTICLPYAIKQLFPLCGGFPEASAARSPWYHSPSVR